MKRYLICSDIHGNTSDFAYALREATRDPLDGVFVAGDIEVDSSDIKELVDKVGCPFYLVKGNCDSTSVLGYKDMMVIDLPDGIKCMLTHGHRYHVKNDLYILADVANSVGANLVIYGHTHMYDDCKMGKLRLLNPGALCGSYFGPGSYMQMTIDKGRVDVIKRVIPD